MLARFVLDVKVRYNYENHRSKTYQGTAGGVGAHETLRHRPFMQKRSRIDFLDKFSLTIRKSTFVVLDNANVHRSKHVKEMICSFIFPNYLSLKAQLPNTASTPSIPFT